MTEAQRSQQGLSWPELEVALEMWEPGQERYVAFVNPLEAKVLARTRKRHPALEIREHREVPRFQVFIWLACDVPDGLMVESKMVQLPIDAKVWNPTRGSGPACPRCREARRAHEIRVDQESGRVVCSTCGYDSQEVGR